MSETDWAGVLLLALMALPLLFFLIGTIGSIIEECKPEIKIHINIGDGSFKFWMPLVAAALAIGVLIG